MDRSRYLGDLSKCVRCGGCKAYCPTYGEDCTESMGTRGRLVLLRELASGRLNQSVVMNERIFSCLLCGACNGTCPLGIDITEAIYQGRTILSKGDKKRRFIRSFSRFATKWPDLTFRMLILMQGLLLPVLAKKGIIPPGTVLPDAPFRKSEQVLTVTKKRGRVAVFKGCSTNFLFPHLGDSLINLLQKAGYEVILPKGETCCGVPLRGLGLEKEAIAMAEKNYQAYSKLKVDAILSPCPTCTLALHTDYPKLIGDGLEKAVDLSVFFNDRLGSAGSIQKTAVYHDPCHLKYGLGIYKEPRELITKAGIDLIEQEESGCCGFGGLFCLSFREISNSLLKKRTEQIIATKAETVITSCPGCLLQLSKTVTDRPVLHLLEVIEEAYCFRTADSLKGQSRSGEEQKVLHQL